MAQVPGSRMQISFLKDLATLRNPSSPFTFLQYLHSNNRLSSFINRSTFAPTRREFSDYLSWVAQHVVLPPNSGPLDPELAKSALSRPQPIQVFYGERVISVRAFQSPNPGDLELLEVISISATEGIVHKWLCKNLIISNGGVANIPSAFLEPGSRRFLSPSRTIHTSNFMDQIDQFLADILFSNRCDRRLESSNVHKTLSSQSLNCSDSTVSLASSTFLSDESRSYDSGLGLGSGIHSANPKTINIAIIGSGQSAAETLLETYHKLKSELSSNSESFRSIEAIKIDLIMRKGHLKPADDSPFVNEIFNPKATDFFYGLKEDDFVELSVSDTRKSSRKNGCDYKRSCRDFVLEEVASTNYSVVSPETLESLYELMYAQKVEEQSERRFNLQLEPKIEIVRYTEVIDAATRKDGSLELRLKDILTKKTYEQEYQLVILGTGYSRESWKSILFSESDEDIETSDLKRRHETVNEDEENIIERSSDHIKGIRLSEVFKRTFKEERGSSISPTNSIISLPSDQLKSYKNTRNQGIEDCFDFVVKRNYRLDLPKTVLIEDLVIDEDKENREKKLVTKKFRPTIWLQGCNESTHGISDSLLSVSSVRAGEILNGIQEEGWFGCD
ncbi:L-lysine 6-monooxygenase (NADPH-requiring)-domain-containing protein [Phakopsora pachyrhizi]|nr:L-lysine 6-monooxygenase (NADPH-requiring)-domain-containing protein [Phakopsora pachyrhizi]